MNPLKWIALVVLVVAVLWFGNLEVRSAAAAFAAGLMWAPTVKSIWRRLG